MAKELDLQAYVFEMIKAQIPKDVNYVDEIGEVLSISSDSVYRRLRGETLLNIEDLLNLALHYNFSLDEFLESSAKRMSFTFQPINEYDFTFKQYLEYIKGMMRRINEDDERNMLYLANDIPLFHLFHSPAIASFKLFFWRKTVLDFSKYRDKRFKLGMKDEKINAISRAIREEYKAIHSTEIYSPETINTSIKQISYYFDSGLFADPSEALILCDELSKLVEHLRMQCEVGMKFKPSERDEVFSLNGDPQNRFGSYEVYFNEVLYTDATILVQSGDRYMSYLTNNGLNVLSTDDDRFYDQHLRQFNILKRRSTHISGSSEKERNRVFNSYQSKIERLKNQLAMKLQADVDL